MTPHDAQARPEALVGRTLMTLEPTRIVGSWMSPPVGDAPDVPATLATQIYDLAGHHHGLHAWTDARVAGLVVLGRAYARSREIGAC